MTLALVAMVHLRRLLWERDQGTCGICHMAVALESVHIDHIVPRSRGGGDELSNLQPSHQSCNSRKGNRDAPRPPKHKVVQLKMRLRAPSPPIAPQRRRRQPNVVAQIKPPLLTLADVASRLGVSEAQAEQRLREERIKVFVFPHQRVSNRRMWRFDSENPELKRLLADMIEPGALAFVEPSLGQRHTGQR